jgi:uncharacterized protein (DUF305 family)
MCEQAAQVRRAAPRRGGPLALAFGLLTAFLVACGPASAAPAPPVQAPNPAFNATDAAWLQLMIPMTEHMVDALTLAADHGGDPSLRALAAAVLTEHRADLDRLQGLRVAAGLPDADVHAGHRMPGMVTAADLVVLRAVHGPDFDRHLRPLLDKHLAQCGVLATGELTNGHQEGVKTLAHAIELSRAHERERLQALR